MPLAQETNTWDNPTDFSVMLCRELEGPHFQLLGLGTLTQVIFRATLAKEPSENQETREKACALC